MKSSDIEIFNMIYINIETIRRFYKHKLCVERIILKGQRNTLVSRIKLMFNISLNHRLWIYLLCHCLFMLLNRFHYPTRKKKFLLFLSHKKGISFHNKTWSYTLLWHFLFWTLLCRSTPFKLPSLKIDENKYCGYRLFFDILYNFKWIKTNRINTLFNSPFY